MTRIVITGLGVLAPNGHGKQAFADALREGQSGIRHVQELADLKFACQVGGIPEVSEELKAEYFSDDKRLAMNSSMTFAGIAAIDCWKDAGPRCLRQLQAVQHKFWLPGFVRCPGSQASAVRLRRTEQNQQNLHSSVLTLQPAGR